MSIRLRFDGALSRSGHRSVAELARHIGVSAPSVFEVISGDRPGRRLLPLISRALGVDERWLRFGDEDVRPPWALPSEVLKPLVKLSEKVESYTTQRRHVPDVLLELLQEQKRIRVLLEETLRELRMKKKDHERDQ
jgi:transcriptional regulator with XRE-family HTH domain